jgi:hypothetical protein
MVGDFEMEQLENYDPRFISMIYFLEAERFVSGLSLRKVGASVYNTYFSSSWRLHKRCLMRQEMVPKSTISFTMVCP